MSPLPLLWERFSVRMNVIVVFAPCGQEKIFDRTLNDLLVGIYVMRRVSLFILILHI